MKNKHFFICASAAALCACTVSLGTDAGSNFFKRFNHRDGQTTEYVDDVELVSSLFDLNNVRAKVSSLAPTSETYSSSEKGLILFSYDTGSTASYKQILSGSTTIRSIASSKDKKTPNLIHYSYKITDIVSNETFKIHVITEEKVTKYYVEADGLTAGESYFTSINGLVTHGYSKLYNNNNTFTEVTSTGLNIDTNITFDAENMSVVVKGQTKNFEVWNFKNDFIDGKAQIKKLSPFDKYKVEVVFEEMVPNSKAELVVYEIGNKKFDSAILNNTSQMFADLSLKGIINEPYYLPTPIGENSENIDVWVYKLVNNEQTEVMSGKLNVKSTFTPDSIGDYYIMYKGPNGELRDKVSVVSSDDITHSFSSNVLDSSEYGYKSTITVPKLTYTTSRSDKDLNALVTIKLGENVLVSNREPGFDFTFDKHEQTTTSDVTYKFIYKCVNNNITEVVEKNVVVSSANGVTYFKPYLEDYSIDSEIEVSKGFYYVDGQEFVCDVDVSYPAGVKEETYSRNDFAAANPKLTLDTNGTYTIRYHIDEKGVNVITKLRAMPEVEELFDTVDVASVKYGNSTSSDINSGVTASFKNDGTLTYKKVIDASTLAKNKMLISLSAQAKTPGKAEMNHIFINVADESDPDNYFEIRMSQGADNVIDKTFIRAKANGQKQYGSYYYDSWFDIEPNIAINYWFDDLKFGTTEKKDFGKFTVDVATKNIDGTDKMTLKIDNNEKNLHFIETEIVSSSFNADCAAFLEEFNNEIDKRLGDGRLTKEQMGTVHEPKMTWQDPSNHDQGGFLHEHSFLASMDTYSYESSDYADFYYDNDEKALYTNFLYHVAGYPTETRIVKICDFDDPNTYGADQVWNGFKTNKIKVTVTATGISDDTGDIFIREICGNKLNNRLLGDDDNPIIDIDDSVIPNAKVGTPFKPLDAIYKDATSAVENKTITVTDPNGSQVNLVNGKFTPTVAGTYTIKYTVKDSFDNESSKSIQIIAKDASYFTAFDCSLAVTDGQAIQYGLNYVLPEPTITGGCGKYSVTKTVSVHTNSGEDLNLDVVDNKVQILRSGTYTVTMKCVDYLGEEKTLIYTFTSAFTSDPIFEDELILPERLFDGVPYQLNHFTCRMFENEGEQQKEIDVKARVTDGLGTRVLGEDMLYTPSYSESAKTATIELFVSSQSGQESVLESKIVELFDLDNTDFILEGYFKNSDNAKLSAFYAGLLLESTDNSGTVETRFVNPINDDNVNFVFSQYMNENGDASLSNLSSVVITLTDFENPDISFDVKFESKANGLFGSVVNNGESSYKAPFDLKNPENYGEIGFSFNKNANSVTDASGSLIGRVSKCSNGDAFNGFTSGKVLVKIKINNIEKDNGLYLIKLSSVLLNNNKEDIISPAIVFSNTFGGTVKENEEVTLPSAYAYDFLSYCGTPTLTIVNSNGDFVKDINGVELNGVSTNVNYTVAFAEYGKYSVIYRAVDSAGNETRVDSYSYSVMDSDPATLTFSNQLSNDEITVNKNSSINLFSYTVQDNAGADNCTVNVYVVLPTSEVITIKNNTVDKEGQPITIINDKYNNGDYKFTGLGRYQILYLVTDSNGNPSVITKYVIVK